MSENAQPETLKRSAFPYLSDQERVDLASNVDKAKQIDSERFKTTHQRAMSNFVTQAKDIKDISDRKSRDHTEEFRMFLDKAEGNHGVALDMFLYTNPDVRRELNQLRKDSPVGYGVFAHSLGESEFHRYLNTDPVLAAEITKMGMARATALSTDVPGLGNAIQTTVSQSIMYRVDNFDPVVSKIQKINLPYGDYEALTYNKYGMAGYIPENDPVPDNTPNINDALGLNKTKFSAKEFGTSFNRSWLSEKRISASVINQLMVITEHEVARGDAFQILSGTGIGLNDSGLINTATAATPGATISDTFINAKTLCNSKNAFNLTAMMNASAWGEYEKLSMINTEYGRKIDVQNMTLHGIPVVILPDTIMPTVAGAARVILGDFSHYIRFTNGGLDKITVRNTSTFAAITAWLIARDGGVLHADSFAQFTITI